MALKTWEIKGPNGTTIKVKALKDDAKRLGNAMHQISNLHQYQRTLSGTIGVDESSYSSMILWGKSSSPIREPEEFEKAKEKFYASLPAPITDIKPVLEQISVIYNAHVPIVDERKTSDEVRQEAAEREANRIVQEEKRKEEQRYYVERFCESADPVDIPEGMMAVCLQFTYDDSDLMSDYYAPHRSIGPAMLLAIVPAQAQTERLCRTVMEQYNTLRGFEWEWHTENYSGGHGNYLWSKTGGYSMPHPYGNEEGIIASPEIKCNKYAPGHISYLPYKGYAQASTHNTGIPSSASDESTPSNGNKPYFKLNNVHQGVEVRFPGKPDGNVISILKTSGFRWSARQKLWYAKQSVREWWHAEYQAIDKAEENP